MPLDTPLWWSNDDRSNDRLLMHIQATTARVEDFEHLIHSSFHPFFVRAGNGSKKEGPREVRKKHNIPARARFLTEVATLFSAGHTRVNFHCGLRAPAGLDLAS